MPKGDIDKEDSNVEASHHYRKETGANVECTCRHVGKKKERPNYPGLSTFRLSLSVLWSGRAVVSWLPADLRGASLTQQWGREGECCSRIFRYFYLHSLLCGASGGRGKCLVEWFINVPQAMGPILQLPCCPSWKGNSPENIQLNLFHDLTAHIPHSTVH